MIIEMIGFINQCFCFYFYLFLYLTSPVYVLVGLQLQHG
jgi:hypothetical protein